MSRFRCLVMVGLVLLSANNFCFSQTVQTLPISGLDGPNGFALDKDGRLYIANEPGKKVVRLIGDTAVEDIVSCDSPDGLAFDDQGNLYVSNFFSGSILKKTNHSVDTFVSGLDKPADIKFDGKGNLFVSEYERGTIKKIMPDKKIVDFASGLKLPFGLIFDNDGNLYVAENGTGRIQKINPSGQANFFAQIPGSITYLAYSKRSAKIYVACLSGHSLYSVGQNGKVELLIGNGEGEKDGNLKEAQFKGPNSIAMSTGGDLYVSEFYFNRIRKITGVEN